MCIGDGAAAATDNGCRPAVARERAERCNELLCARVCAHTTIYGRVCVCACVIPYTSNTQRVPAAARRRAAAAAVAVCVG